MASPSSAPTLSLAPSTSAPTLPTYAFVIYGIGFGGMIVLIGAICIALPLTIVVVKMAKKRRQRLLEGEYARAMSTDGWSVRSDESAEQHAMLHSPQNRAYWGTGDEESPSPTNFDRDRNRAHSGSRDERDNIHGRREYTSEDRSSSPAASKRDVQKHFGDARGRILRQKRAMHGGSPRSRDSSRDTSRMSRDGSRSPSISGSPRGGRERQHSASSSPRDSFRESERSASPGEGGSLTGLSVDRVAGLFAKYDADDSGTLDMEELPDVMQELTGGARMSEADAAGITAWAMQSYDLDGSGDLDLDEFQSLVEDWWPKYQAYLGAQAEALASVSPVQRLASVSPVSHGEGGSGGDVHIAPVSLPHTRNDTVKERAAEASVDLPTASAGALPTPPARDEVRRGAKEVLDTAAVVAAVPDDPAPAMLPSPEVDAPEEEPAAATSSLVHGLAEGTVEELFTLFDADGSGSLDVVEIPELLKMLAGGIDMEPDEEEGLSKWALETFDVDGDGTLGLPEVEALVAEWWPHYQEFAAAREEPLFSDERVNELFREFDADDGGFLDAHELPRLLQALVGNLTMEPEEEAGIAQWAMDEFDTDGSGGLGISEVQALVAQWWPRYIEYKESIEGGGGEESAAAWRSVLDDDGETYYENTATGETQWEQPPNFQDF